MDLNFYSIVLLTLCLGIAVVTDLHSHRIPNGLSVFMLFSGLSIQSVGYGLQGTASSLGGLCVGLACFLPFYLKGNMGAGDVKLMAVIGTFIGVKLSILSVGYTLIFGGIFAIIFLIGRGCSKELFSRYQNMIGLFFGSKELVYIPPVEGDPAKRRFPYAIAIAAGTLTAIYLFG